MRVILLHDVKGVGQKGTIQEVSDGFALNALIPQGKAAQATPEKEAEAKKRLAAAAAHAEAMREMNERMASAIEGKRVKVGAHANAHGHLYKQLERSAIADAIRAQLGANVPADSIRAKIREVGTHDVSVRLGDREAHLSVEVGSA